MKKTSGKIILLICSMLALLLVSCTDSVAPVYTGTPVRIIDAEKLSELEHQFDRYRYDLDSLHSGVPPLVLKSFPEELTNLHSAKKKQVFFQTLLPMILLANSEIRRERKSLLRLDELVQSDESTLSDSDLHLLQTLAKRYGVKFSPENPRVALNKLLLRVDIIPTDLALAQAANESAYGTSRFSLLANNLFGEWTFTPGTGIVPEGRPEGEIYEVRRFESLLDSVRSYQKNLNTHSAYSHFRQLRAAARSEQRNLSGQELAKGLLYYSTRREDYVKDLQALIRHNRLDRYTTATLKKS